MIEWKSQGAPIATRPPFDLRLTVSALRRLPTSTLYRLEGAEFRFVAALPSGPRLLAVRQSNDIQTALAWTALDGALAASDEAAAPALIARMLDVRRDLTPLHALFAGEPSVAELAERLAGMKPPRFATLWEAFCQIVPFQLVSLQAAIATLNRFVAALGPSVNFGSATYWGVPAPERALSADDATLRSCGLSVAKARTLQGIAERALAGELDVKTFEGLSDAEAMARLTSIPGIGPWSAQVALLRGLGRMTVFPSGDSGAARGLRRLFPESSQPESDASALLARLGDWRGYLYFMLLGRRLLDAE